MADTYLAPMIQRRKLFLYSSLLITLLLNSPRLLALKKDGIVSRYFRFDALETSIATILTFIFCLTIFHYNRDRAAIFLQPGRRRQKLKCVGANLAFLAGFTLLGYCIEKLFFAPTIFPAGGYGFRFSLSLIFIALEVRIYILIQDSRKKEIENTELRNAWLQSELAVLKGQLNPHFLFNSLSSLSAIVREDPRKAQRYISHLSKVFRYTLQLSETHLVSLKEELQALRSYAQLLEMRYEQGFQLIIPNETEAGRFTIPPMSLQLLVENALKHNRASVDSPLQVTISIEGKTLIVKNNLQPLRIPEPGAGIGLANLNQRFQHLLQQDISLYRDNKDFIVKLPLS